MFPASHICWFALHQMHAMAPSAKAGLVMSLPVPKSTPYSRYQGIGGMKEPKVSPCSSRWLSWLTNSLIKKTHTRIFQFCENYNFSEQNNEEFVKERTANYERQRCGEKIISKLSFSKTKFKIFKAEFVIN